MNIKRNLGILAVSIALTGCSPSKTETTPDETVTETGTETTTDEKADIVALYQAGVESFSAGEMDPAAFTDDVQLTSAMPAAEGKDAVMAAMAQWRAPFPDLKVKSAHILVLGENMIAVEGVSNGTHTAPMGEVPASNKAMGLNWFQLVTFEGDKIKHIDAMSNPMTTMQQIGAVPAPGDNVPAVPAMPGETQIVKGEANADNEAVATAYFAAMSAGDGEALGALVAPDFKLIHHGMNATMTFEQAGEHMANLGKGLTEMSLTVEKMHSVGDWVIARAPFSAKHTGELMGMPATNKTVSTPTYQVMRIADGKVAQVTEYVNIMHFAGQMQPEQQAAK
jgi:steroid delta-isomerase-like uncharacterized protein